MKYGIMGGFIRLAFAGTAFDYIKKTLPDIEPASYRKRVIREYKAIVKRTPGIGKMKDNMFVVTMYAGAFLIALYKESDGKLDEEKLHGSCAQRRTARLWLKRNRAKAHSLKRRSKHVKDSPSGLESI